MPYRHILAILAGGKIFESGNLSLIDTFKGFQHLSMFQLLSFLSVRQFIFL